MNISYSGMNATKKEIEVISSNLANALTTRTVEGGPYRRRYAVLEGVPIHFDQALSKAEARMSGGGVQVSRIEEDQSPPQRVYRPGHPDADVEGFVNLPNVRQSQEMVDLLFLSRLHEANLTAYNTTKKMAQDTLQIQ